MIEKPKYKSFNKLKEVVLPEPIDTFFKPIGSDFYNNIGELKKLFEETNKYKVATLEKFI